MWTLAELFSQRSDCTRLGRVWRCTSVIGVMRNTWCLWMNERRKLNVRWCGVWNREKSWVGYMKHWLICSRFITYRSGTVTGGETLDASHRTHSWISLSTYPADVLAVSNGPAVTLMIYYCLCFSWFFLKEIVHPENKMILTHPRRVFFLFFFWAWWNHMTALCVEQKTYISGFSMHKAMISLQNTCKHQLCFYGVLLY